MGGCSSSLDSYARSLMAPFRSHCCLFWLVSGLTRSQKGLLLSLTLVGDTVVSLYLTTHADRFGRRRMLIAGAILMAAAGLVFAGTSNFFALMLGAPIG